MMATAKNFKSIGILSSLFIILSFGLSDPIAAQLKSKDQEIGRDRHYIAFASGVVRDTKTGLEWVAGPDKATNFDEAKRYVEHLTVAGGGWRLPAKEELEALYEKGKGSQNMTPLLKTTGLYVWSGESEDPSTAWGFSFLSGSGVWIGRGESDFFIRAFAVRSRK
ncbi:MAG: DUF1566 domain-containing protein [Deltaproteobacteria bacterium]|nr:DUF1566 domain-containing protein [Deltaproteobacteria bacterium]